MTENSEGQDKKEVNLFEKEIERLPQELKEKILIKKPLFEALVNAIKEKSQGKDMGFYIVPDIKIVNNMPTPNFDLLTLHFLLDDFERPIPEFNPKILLGSEFDKHLVENKKKDEYGQEVFTYTFKKDETLSFKGTSVSILRETCFDGVYDDLKALGSSFIYEDSRGFIGALKSIDIHRNMLLQKFEKYIVVYAGAGSWLRGEKSNDFDVFIVVDDTDVKRMPRMQVKEQLTRIIWQMSREVAALTGVQVHIQVYLLTDFWDALKDAHPVMFTFLRDGVPFYDRGLYSAWKELLKLGKIRPSPEAIDMHMNAGTQLLDRAKKMFSDIVINDVYNAVLSPSQAILMLKGYNPTTPKETVQMFKEVLLAKEKSVTAKHVEVLEETLNFFKKIEHDRELEIKGAEVDRLIKNADDFLKHIKKMFEEISEERTKESIFTSYNELLSQLRTLREYNELSEQELFSRFDKEYVKSGKLPSFIGPAIKNIEKAKQDYEKGKITVTEVNKVLKEMRNVLSEVKNYRDRNSSVETGRKLRVEYGKNKVAELFKVSDILYLSTLDNQKMFEYNSGSFQESKQNYLISFDSSKLENFALSNELLKSIKALLKTDEILI